MFKDKKEAVLLLGFGDIAQRLSKKLIENKDQYEVTGVRRSMPAKSKELELVQMDVCDKLAMAELLKKKFDIIVMTMTPDDISDDGYRQAYIDSSRNLLEEIKKQSHQPRLIIFVSSTSVYGQKNAEWVDEDSIVEPTSFSGKRLLEAEALFKQSKLPYCIIRFSGIYGPGRHRLIEQVLDGQGSDKKPVLYSNRIHADDCAGVINYLIGKQKKEKIDSLYLATDCQPTPLYDVKNWLAKQLQISDEHLKPKTTGRLIRSSKRCRNQRLLKSGYQFLYPTFKEGYLSVLKDYQ